MCGELLICLYMVYNGTGDTVSYQYIACGRNGIYMGRIYVIMMFSEKGVELNRQRSQCKVMNTETGVHEFGDWGHGNIEQLFRGDFQ